MFQVPVGAFSSFLMPVNYTFITFAVQVRAVQAPGIIVNQTQTGSIGIENRGYQPQVGTNQTQHMPPEYSVPSQPPPYAEWSHQMDSNNQGK